jgi:hypothetical protein
MSKCFLILLIIVCLILLKNSKEFYQITMRGLNLMPLDIPVPSNLPVYKGYIDYKHSQVHELCPSIKKKDNKQDVSCKTRADCGPAEVCINTGVSTYCQCSITNDCIYSGIC